MPSNNFLPSQNADYTATATRILQSGEPGTFLLPPNTNKSNIFLNQIKERNSDKYHIVVLDLATTEIDDAHDVEFLLKKELARVKKKKCVFFISNARNLILNKNFTVINSILDLLKFYKNAQLFFFFNVDITHPDFAKNLRSKIFANLIYFPLYDRQDTLGFIKYFSHEWKIPIESKEEDKIVSFSGGYVWLLKQILRCLRDQPTVKLDNVSECNPVLIALEQFYGSLLESEKNVIKSLIYGKKIEDMTELHSKEYLERLKVIDKNEIRIGLLENYVRKMLPKMSIELKNGSIYLNSVIVDSHFSQKERRALRALLDNSNVIVSRDELAKAIWPVKTEEFYSDWAVDRIVARLRDKIEELGLSKDIIKTQRNKGYMLEV